jgi:hypothetical protein
LTSNFKTSQKANSILEKIVGIMIPFTFDFSTSGEAHKILGKIMQAKCENAKTPNYGLEMKPDTILRIANTDLTRFLIQSELKA